MRTTIKGITPKDLIAAATTYGATGLIFAGDTVADLATPAAAAVRQLHRQNLDLGSFLLPVRDDSVASVQYDVEYVREGAGTGRLLRRITRHGDPADKAPEVDFGPLVPRQLATALLKLLNGETR